jgi:predicted short-subunit dehydrogenase-like oxidoreductase (DUF2520 family)
MPALCLIGPGRAGHSVAGGLVAAGWELRATFGRGDDVSGAAAGVDLLLVATPDPAIADVAAAVAPVDGTVVAHLAGSRGLDVLAPHRRRASLHPVVSMAERGTDLTGAWFAVAGDPLAGRVVDDLGGRAVAVADEHRTLHHAAATIAANHLVALLGQVERVAAGAGVPLEAYLALARGALANVERLGPAAALTGPVRRGDEATVARHLAALPPEERDAYVALADAARRLVRAAGA